MQMKNYEAMRGCNLRGHHHDREAAQGQGALGGILRLEGMFLDRVATLSPGIPWVLFGPYHWGLEVHISDKIRHPTPPYTSAMLVLLSSLYNIWC